MIEYFINYDDLDKKINKIIFNKWIKDHNEVIDVNELKLIFGDVLDDEGWVELIN